MEGIVERNECKRRKKYIIRGDSESEKRREEKQGEMRWCNFSCDVLSFGALRSRIFLFQTPRSEVGREER